MISGKDTILINRLINKGESTRLNDPVVALQYIDSALAIAESSDYQNGMIRAYEVGIKIHQDFGLWDESLEMLSKAIRIRSELNDHEGVLRLKSSQANLLWDIGRFDQSIIEANEVLEAARLQKNPYYEARGHHDLAYAFEKKGNYESALHHARQYAHLIPENIATSDSSFGDFFPEKVLIYFLLVNREDREAEKLILKFDQYQENGLSVFDNYFYNSQIGKAYIFRKEYERALPYLEKSNTYNLSLHSRAHNLELATNYFNLYKGWGKHEKALFYLSKIRELEQEIAFDRINLKSRELSNALEVQKQKIEIDNLIIERQKKAQLTLWIALILTGLIFGYVVWTNRRLRQKNSKISKALLEGQTTERKRVASDLHDSLGSTLSSLRWSFSAIDKTKLDPKEQEIYHYLERTLDTAYDQVRLLSHNLLPLELQKQGLWKALELLVGKLNKVTGVRFTLQLPEYSPRLSSKTEFEIYSICLELMNNVLKHAQALNVNIVLEKSKDTLILIVTDDGRGMPEKATTGKGLNNITERVNELNGTWNITENKPSGTVHMFRFPL